MGYVLVLRHLKPRPGPASTLRCHKLAPRNILPPLLTLGLYFFRHLPIPVLLILPSITNESRAVRQILTQPCIRFRDQDDRSFAESK